jgi:hypothetical protein
MKYLNAILSGVALVLFLTAPYLAPVIGAGAAVAVCLVSGVTALASYIKYREDKEKTKISWPLPLLRFASLAGAALLSFTLAPRAGKTAAPEKKPVEEIKQVSFVDHKDGFNTTAQNDQKTLVLKAKDFAAAPKTKA